MNERQTDTTDDTPVTQRHIWNWKDMVLITVASVVLLLAGAFGLASLTGFELVEEGTGEPPSLLFSSLLAALETVALVGGIYLFGLRRKGLSWQSVGIRPTSAAWIIAAAGVTLVLIPLVGAIALLIQIILDLPLENPQLEFLAPGDFSWLGAISMILFGGVAVPIAEELFFRGVLYRWLRDRWGVWVGILVSSILFGVVHGNIAIAGATFFMGVFLAWFYEQSQSLWPSITIHALNNSLKLILLYSLIALGIPVEGF